MSTAVQRCNTFLFISCILLIKDVESAPQLSLTSSPLSNGPICPGPIQFTCMGAEVASVLMWRINGSDYARVEFNGTLFPLITYYPLIPGVEVPVMVTSVSVNQENNATIDIRSTLRSNVSVLTGSIIQCSALISSSEVHVRAIAAPPSTYKNCSLVHTTGGPEVSIQWSPSFTSQYNVNIYHVVVNPATTFCPRDQMISPSEDYSCSGLVLGTRYSFNVSAINCGNQEGTSDTFTIQPQVPRTPEITLLPVYDKDERLRLNRLTVQWMQQVTIQSPSERCFFNQLLSYTVVLEDSTRERVDQRMINSNDCNDNLCSISFPLSSPDQSYFVSVNVTGAFGSTNTSTSLNTSIPSSFDVSFSSEGCVTSVLCSYPMREGDYFFQYGRDSSYQDLSPSLSTSLNSPLQITISDAATIHYYQVTINTSSLSLQVRGNFTSGGGAQLTSANQGLLVVGVILLSVAIILGVIIIWMVFTKGPWLSLSLCVAGFIVTFVSLVLWVAVGFYVGLQKNTCDPTWQSSRDGLIISAHVFSDISLLIFVAAGIYFAMDYISLPNYKKRSSERMSFWQKCLHRSLSNSNQYQPRVKDWEANKPKDQKLEELEVGKGGRIKELEDLTVGEFRKPGQSYMEAKLATQERVYQEYKDKLPTDGSKGEEPASKGKGEDSHYRLLDHGKGGRDTDKQAREGRKNVEQTLTSCGPSPSQTHHNEEKDQHYLPLDHKKGGSKDSTQGGSGEEYSALGNSKESGRKPSSQPHKEEGEDYLQLDHGKGDRSGHKDKPSSTQKESREYSALKLKDGPGGRVKELEDLNADGFRKPGQSYIEAKLEAREGYYQEYKDKLPTY